MVLYTCQLYYMVLPLFIFRPNLRLLPKFGSDNSNRSPNKNPAIGRHFPWMYIPYCFLLPADLIVGILFQSRIQIYFRKWNGPKIIPLGIEIPCLESCSLMVPNWTYH